MVGGKQGIGMKKEHNNKANMHASINLDMERLLKNSGILKSTNHDQTMNVIRLHNNSTREQQRAEL
ncbi:hypothetical protein E2562_035151 [Oryza meyeriana var. granulata]|uniref:Uncharacterized protein n=1 Tax=Oryza meyeriana var. granulata TaxID=110450 RepID=A0A6G1E6P0_9ORYZ|nr:hypothetical protein E2562_035151 [Oryza meyeriana var. granulata]